MKSIRTFFTLLCIVAAGCVWAQPETSHGFNAGSNTDNNISAVVGQPFDAVFSGGGYEVSEGVSQAQLVHEEYTASVKYGEGYEEHGFSYPATTQAGTYNDSRYEVGGAQYGYDLLAELLLKVLDCGETVYDGNNNPYSTVVVASRCWTQQNLRPTLYPDGTTEIDGAMEYQSSLHPDATANVNTYGRLYTWAAASHANADGTVTLDADGFVQGICPDGWHIPTAEEKAALDAENADDLRTAELWVAPNSHTNSKGFTALPAGKYDGTVQQFIGLLSQTDWWSVADGTGIPAPSVIELQYYCDSPLDGTPSAADGLSVRCVKNN